MMRWVLAILTVIGLVAACDGPKSPSPSLDSSSKGKSKKTKDSAADEVAALAEKYDECFDKEKVWTPPEDEDLEIEGESTVAGHCGAALADFCCTMDEIKVRYVGAEVFEPKIKEQLDAGLQIYACSKPDAKTLRVHFLKREKKAIAYQEVKIAGAGSSTGKAGDGACKVDMAAMLRGDKVEIGADRESAGTDKVFDEQINPILKKYCDGGACHANGNKTPTAYVGKRAAMVANKASHLQQIESGDMPKGKTMDEDDEKKLVDWLKGL